MGALGLGLVRRGGTGASGGIALHRIARGAGLQQRVVPRHGARAGSRGSARTGLGCPGQEGHHVLGLLAGGGRRAVVVPLGGGEGRGAQGQGQGGVGDPGQQGLCPA